MVSKALEGADVSRKIAKPNAAYTQRAWLAVGGILLFVIIYLAFIAWFVWTAVVCFQSIFTPGIDSTLPTIVAAPCATFMGAFMIKALFFVRRSGGSTDMEVTRETQPRLFEFLDTLANEAGAPKPAHVYLSARVNAAVFYDLSILNLVWPSKKNLEIGLGLINVLNVSEFRAVCAHEFGHFAQRTMAVGRWVYIAQQIAGDIVAKRGSWDNFLTTVSRLDIRIAWVGWILRLIVWAVRSLMDSVFHVALLAERALSREMEMQADLVAVSLTGSDALIHGLHRLQAADEAWDATLDFANGELRQNRSVKDLFAIQTRELELLFSVTRDDRYGPVPPVPAEQPQSHRLFKAELAQPPRMWSTHPLNHEREENAKRHYRPATLDTASAWSIFDDPQSVRETVSARLQDGAKDAQPAPIEESIKRLEDQFEREHYKPDYRGVYLGRSPVLDARKKEDLYSAEVGDVAATLDSLYPEILVAQHHRLRTLEKELAQLEAVGDGRWQATDGVLRYRGRALRKRELPSAIADLRKETESARTEMGAHDRLCRTVHRQAARQIGHGWEDYLVGLAGVLHYATHAEADLRDAQAALGNMLAVETAAHKVSSDGATRIVESSFDLYRSLRDIYDKSGEVEPGDTILASLEAKSWKELLGDLELGMPTLENINDWLRVSDSWVDFVANHLASLRSAALGQLLTAERQVASFYRAGAEVPDAPPAPKVPSAYATLTRGQERPRRKLGLWQRFQTADGWLPGLARLVVALAIIVPVLGFGIWSAPESKLVIYNGLATTVHVSVNDKSYVLPPDGHKLVSLDRGRAVDIQTTDAKGHLIESLQHSLQIRETSVYNVAGASPLIDWVAVYGNVSQREPRNEGAGVWGTTRASVLFEDPPEHISTSKRSSGGTREVLSGLGNQYPGVVMNNVPDPKEQQSVIAAHARWDAADSRYLGIWLYLLKQHPDGAQILQQRLKDDPSDIAALRAQISLVSGTERDAFCQQRKADAASHADNGDLQYVSLRCLTMTERNAAVMAAKDRWPSSTWWANAVGYEYAYMGEWNNAADFLRRAVANPAIQELTSIDLARIERLRSGSIRPPSLADLLEKSFVLRYLMAPAQEPVEQGSEVWTELAAGHLDKAVQLAQGSSIEEDVARLAAASKGAPESLIRRAIGPDSTKLALNDDTVWSSMALAARMKSSLKPYDDYLAAHKDVNSPDSESDLASMRAFLANALAGKTVEAEASLNGLSPNMRGQAYVMGVVVLGDKAPPQWRQRAGLLLFAKERPYLG